MAGAWNGIPEKEDRNKTTSSDDRKKDAPWVVVRKPRRSGKGKEVLGHVAGGPIDQEEGGPSVGSRFVVLSKEITEINNDTVEDVQNIPPKRQVSQPKKTTQGDGTCQDKRTKGGRPMLMPLLRVWTKWVPTLVIIL